MKKNVTILGCGRWGSFHAWYQTEVLKNDTVMWGRAQDDCFGAINASRKNSFVTLPDGINITSNLAEALNHSEYIIIAISAQGIKELAVNIAASNPENKTFILAMKGICEQTGERLSEIFKSYVDKSNKICAWVGPGHVQDFLAGQPGVMIIAAEDEKVAVTVAERFTSGLIKFYVTCDLLGAEIGAAATNVLGVAAGMLDGARAPTLKGALMVRGAYEVSCLIKAMGGNIMTTYGLAHLGDFEAKLFTANSHSRGYGEEFYKAWEEKRSPQCMGLVDGIPTSKAIRKLCKKYNVEMPICRAVYKMLHENESPRERFTKLFLRPHKEEFRYD